MEATTILVVENVSKQYRLGQVGTGTISHDLNRWWYKIRGKEDPYLKIGDSNDRSTQGESDYVWALKDINFEVKKGEVIGIIGKNGAGKSTLLKILSKVTAPTEGSVKYNGRIASLLEVGTGFHPELTGRENIYLNGAILGMTKKEISTKIDAIIEFSGCQRYVDTPVKRYSSGMTVRLAFAVAAFLEPEILIIDEVLAVGDAEFQKKALGKMQDISKGEGRTVLFVSHNMAAVSNLCSRVIVLQHGQVCFNGPVDQGINDYLQHEGASQTSDTVMDLIQQQDDDAFLLKKLSVTQENAVAHNFYSNKDIEISMNFDVLKDVIGLRVGFDLINMSDATVIFRSFHDDTANEMNTIATGTYKFRAIIPANILKNGSFGIKPAIGIHNVRWIIHSDNLVLPFTITNVEGLNSAFADSRPGIIMPQLFWEKLTDK